MMPSSLFHMGSVLQESALGHTNPSLRQATGAICSSDTLSISPTVYCPAGLESL